VEANAEACQNDLKKGANMQRRELLAFFGLSSIGFTAFSQGRIPIADAHNHLGLLRRNTESPRVLRRLQTLRRWSHEQEIKSFFT
jgi:hypothetical protein